MKSFRQHSTARASKYGKSATQVSSTKGVATANEEKYTVAALEKDTKLNLWNL